MWHWWHLISSWSAITASRYLSESAALGLLYVGVRSQCGAETAQPRAQETVSAITALIQMHLYMKCIYMRIFISVYIR